MGNDYYDAMINERDPYLRDVIGDERYYQGSMSGGLSGRVSVRHGRVVGVPGLEDESRQLTN